MLLQPVEKEISGKKFLLSKFPAIAGREIVAKYSMSGFPDIVDYKVNEDTMLKLMSYVAVPLDNGATIQLTTRELVNNHVPHWKMLMQIEHEMIELNSDFL